MGHYHHTSSPHGRGAGGGLQYLASHTVGSGRVADEPVMGTGASRASDVGVARAPTPQTAAVPQQLHRGSSGHGQGPQHRPVVLPGTMATHINSGSTGGRGGGQVGAASTTPAVSAAHQAVAQAAVPFKSSSSTAADDLLLSYSWLFGLGGDDEAVQLRHDVDQQDYLVMSAASGGWVGGSGGVEERGR